MLSLGALIPIISIIFSENETGINLIDQIISNYTFEQKIVYLAAGLFFIFFIKSIYQTFLYFYQGKYTANLSMLISNYLYQSFVNLDYLRHIKDNSSKKIQYIGNESNTIVQGYLRPVMVLFTEIFLIFGISLLLIIVDPLTFFISLIFFTLSFGIINLLFARRLSFIGRERAFNEMTKLKKYSRLCLDLNL